MPQTLEIIVPHVREVGPVTQLPSMGGSAELKKMGPKDLQIEVRGLSLLRYAYVRSTYGALMRAALLLFGARTAYVNVTRWQPGSSDLVLLAAWA